MTSPSFNLSSYDSVEFKFYFYANSMENGEDFGYVFTMVQHGQQLLLM